MNERLRRLLDEVLERPVASASDVQRAVENHRWLVSATDDELAEFFRALVENWDAPTATSWQQRLIGRLCERLVQRARKRERAGRSTALAPAVRENLVTLYRQLPSAETGSASLLALLASSRQEPDLRALAELLADRPPQDATGVALALSPLFQSRDYPAQALFPTLLEAIAQPTIAAPILDLMNFLTRERFLPDHPARQRLPQLLSLLGELVQRLGQIEELPLPEDLQEARQRIAQVNEGVALAVALCDSVALIGDSAAVGKLNQALDLKHRRLRTEAAAALARLGQENGRQALLELAREPVARLRVLHYAEELDLLEQIDEQYQSPTAVAESELAIWLAQPGQFGIAPSRLELVDTRELYWPSYEQPMSCYLFRFTYQIGSSGFSNIGIAGPLVHAFNADLADMPVEQIYAAFAGWQAEHEEIRELAPQRLAPDERSALRELEDRLRSEGYQRAHDAIIGYFFGELVLVARANRSDISGIVVADRDQTYWFPASGPRPLGPDEAWCIWKGQRLLKAFNE